MKLFNLVSPENSDSWNCLSEIEGQELMAQLFVDVIIKNTMNGSKGDHFWDSAEMNLLKALVLYVDQGYDTAHKNIGEVYRLLTLNSENELNGLFENLAPAHPAKAPYAKLYKGRKQTVKRAADNKRRYAPGEGSIPPVLLSGVSKGVPPLAHDFACKV